MSRLLGLGLAVLGLSLPGVAQAQHPHECDAAGAQPVLSVADYDGDGTVTGADVSLLATRIGGEYIAYFDANADGVLDGKDAVEAAHDIGASSTPLDQQLADLFWSTEMYRDKNAALAVGYRPFTQTLKGHGQHYSKLPFLATPTGLDPNYDNILDGNLIVGEPEGLNYDEDGNLIAVFYYHNIDVKDWVFANQFGDAATVAALFSQSVNMSWMSAASGGMHPHIYHSHDAMWHQHWGACWDGLDYVMMAFDPSIVPNFNQHMFPAECAARAQPGVRQGYIPAFNMLHVWLYKLNPCGVFAGTHPHASPSAPVEPVARPLEMWFHMMGIPNPYGDGGGHH